MGTSFLEVVEEGERHRKGQSAKNREVMTRTPGAVTVFFISKIEIIMHSMGGDCEG